MKRLARPVSLGAVLVIGLLLGVWVQHRWPLGRIRDEWSRRPTPTPATPASLAQLPADRRLVLVCVGQSNAANYGEPRRSAGPGVYAFAAGQLYNATDPLPGGDGYGGSIWTRLGARLASRAHSDAIVFAVLAQGSTYAADWAPGGHAHPRLAATLAQLAAAGLPANYILWHQGEEEGRDPAHSGPAYAASLAALQAACRTLAPTAPFLVARATYGEATAVNEQIRLAQTAAGQLPGAHLGPDFDTLGADYRRDGIHFNARGLDAAADLWLQTLSPLLPPTQPPGRTP